MELLQLLLGGVLVIKPFFNSAIRTMESLWVRRVVLKRQNPGEFGCGTPTFDFKNASGTFEPGPQYLENAVNFPGLTNFRKTAVINTIGMSGQDQTFYWFLTSSNSDQASMGYDFMTLPGN